MPIRCPREKQYRLDAVRDGAKRHDTNGQKPLLLRSPRKSGLALDGRRMKISAVSYNVPMLCNRYDRLAASPGGLPCGFFAVGGRGSMRLCVLRRGGRATQEDYIASDIIKMAFSGASSANYIVGLAL